MRYLDGYPGKNDDANDAARQRQQRLVGSEASAEHTEIPGDAGDEQRRRTQRYHVDPRGQHSQRRDSDPRPHSKIHNLGQVLPGEATDTSYPGERRRFRRFIGRHNATSHNLHTDLSYL